MTPKTDDAAAIRALQVSLRAALQVSPGTAHSVVRDAFKANPENFFQAGFGLLQTTPPSSERLKIFAGILDRPEFLLQLIRPGRYSLRELTRTCRRFAAIDRRLDLRLAGLLPGRWEDVYSLSNEVIIRVLHVLDEISTGPRLIPILGHLTTHEHPAVAETATLLIGRRVRNWGWTQRRLESGGPEVRAGVVEGLWGVDTPQARRTMRNCLQDASERVVGKALFGLHLLQEDDVQPLVQRMAEDDRPAFRATAAWLAGRIDQPEYDPILERARVDSSPAVRLAAKEAMAARRQEAAVKPKPKPAEVPPTQAVAPPEPKPATEPKPAEPKPKPRKRELHLRLDGTSTTTRWD